jgi:hypothetical protein
LRQLALLAFVTLPTGACASASLEVLKPMTPPGLEAAVLQIEPGPAGQASEEEVTTFRNIVVETLADEGIAVTTGQPSGRTAVLIARIDEHDPGDQFLRWLVGFGAGAGHLDSTWMVKDASGTEIGKARIQGTVSGGFFGGSYDSALSAVAVKVAAFLKGDHPPPGTVTASAVGSQ